MDSPNTELRDGLIENKAYVDRMRKLLDSNDVKSKLTAMSELMTKISDGVDVSDFFPQVVKNVIVDSLDVKKLVYAFLIHFAEKKPEIALLSINSFQNGLKDSNQMVRAMNLRVMSSIRIKMIVPLILLAVRKSVSDSSPFVRKVSALAMMKVIEMEKERKEECIKMLQILMADKSTLVLGAAIIAFEEICPERWDIVHPHFRRICGLVADFDEWAQIVACQMLLRYARVHLARPTDYSVSDMQTIGAAPENSASMAHFQQSEDYSVAVNPSGIIPGTVEMDLDSFYDDIGDVEPKGEEEEAEMEQVNTGNLLDDDMVRSGERNEPEVAGGESMTSPPAEKADSANGEADMKTLHQAVGSDHRLMLRGTESLLKSRNSAVVLSVAVLHMYTAPKHEVNKVVNALLRLTKDKRETSYVILCNIMSITGSNPALFQPYIKEFFVSVRDPVLLKTLKLNIITNLVTKDNINLVLTELNNSINSSDKAFASAAIRAIGRAAVRLPNIADRCLITLTELIKRSKNTEVVAECVIVMKKLMQVLSIGSSDMFRDKIKDLAVKLVHVLESVDEPNARASTIWIIGEYGKLLLNIAPDTLRILAKNFTQEKPVVKLQIMMLAVKLYLVMKADDEATGFPNASKAFETVASLTKYVLTLCKYDPVYDIRDRCRLISNVLFPPAGGPEAFETSAGALQEKASEIFLVSKPAPALDSGTDGISSFTIGTLSHIVKQVVKGYKTLPDFPDVPTDPSVRDFVPPPAETVPEDNYEKYDDSGDESDGSYSSYSSDGSYSSSYSSGSYSYSEGEDGDVGDLGMVEETREAGPVATATEAAHEPERHSDRHGLNLLDFSLDGSDRPVGVTDVQIERGAATQEYAPIEKMDFSSYGEPESPSVMTTSLPSHELLNYTVARGLSVTYSMSRTPSRLLEGAQLVRLVLQNKSASAIRDIECELDDAALEKDGIKAIPFQKISELLGKSVVDVTMTIKFVDKSQSLKFKILTLDGEYPVRISPDLGEMFLPFTATFEEVDRIMRESSKSRLPGDDLVFRSKRTIKEMEALVMKSCNFGRVEMPRDLESKKCCFTGKLATNVELDDGERIIYLMIVHEDDSDVFNVVAHSEDSLLCGRVLQSLKKILVD